MEKKKSLGQHFLTSEHYLRLIADVAQIQPGEKVLEIGPGEGVLTRELLSRGADVVAVEKDARLIPVLKETFAGQKLTVVEADALLIEPENFGMQTGAYILVGNIPYYITGALFKKFLTTATQPHTLVFLIQKEVGERVARSKKESILSLSVKAYGEVKYVKTVPRGAFSPPPAVDSAILTIRNISRKNFTHAEHEKKFFQLMRAGFAQKRKLLRSNLEAVLGSSALEHMIAAGIPEKARAEDVPLEKWLKLCA
jgi:16S rRNA (adenine1518-N6/adenine1519-N6)-dimethyltransferase